MPDPTPTTLPASFWERVDFLSSDHGCWLWTAAIANGGYSSFYWRKRRWTAHRLSYAEAYGPIPPGLEVDHLCRVRHCVNPSHLEAVTSRENVLRGISPAADAARRTACSHGHSLTDPENVYPPVPSRPRARNCKTCARDRARAQRAAARASRKRELAA